MAQKQALRQGDFLKIGMDDGTFCFARVLHEPYMAFYGLRSEDERPIDEVAQSKVLFKLAVMNRAVTSGRWRVIGNLPLEEELRQPVKSFRQDPITKKLSIYVNGADSPATPEACANLERAAVWDPEHVEDRLRDHFAGVPNKWVESLRFKE
ncbi:immunity 26/phosphotriesterase HocA family protein [Sinorhizobium meliloti]|uniref:immunity 26/phosphotriesterase HocA family protein n=1 Tax=Rhizobium meliloti TaxID=382 RepID=UPI003D64FCFA